MGMARIHVVEQDEAEGRLAEIYEQLVGSRGKLAEVHKIQSLNPESIPAHMDLYMKVMFSRSPLSRAEREMMAVVVSATNRCAYCIRHHGEALDHFWKEWARVEELARLGGELRGLSSREQALCVYARRVTEDPAGDGVERAVTDLREEGLDDRAILDATLVASYFNFVNRMVLALGVELEKDAGGYLYE